VAVHQPVFLQPVAGDAAINYSAQEFRQYTRAILAGSEVVAGVKGVTEPADYKVTQRGAGANFSVDVAAGLAYVIGGDVTNQGTYTCWNDGTVNVPTPSPPGSGTQNHRVVLQVQDKLSNGTWTGYQGAIMLLADTGSGTPAEPNSAITLALVAISAGQASVLNANITDYRRMVGPIAAVKTGDLGRTHATAPADDPDLQLLNLQLSAVYDVEGMIFYKGGSGAGEGDLAFTWRFPGTAGGSYDALRTGTNATWQGGNSFAWSETHSAQTTGTSNPLSVWVRGTFTTGASAPQYLVFQWAQNSDTGTATTVQANSWLRTVRVA
jgi:hypothetical protein